MNTHHEIDRKRSGEKGNRVKRNYWKQITTNELRRMIEIPAPRERALIYLMTLSGMSQAEARN